MRAISARRIREYLGHRGIGSECHVRIHRDSNVERYGSPNPTDRSKDYWAWMGTCEQIAREIRNQDEREANLPHRMRLVT